MKRNNVVLMFRNDMKSNQEEGNHTYSEAIVLLLNFQLNIFTSSANIEWTNKHPQETFCIFLGLLDFFSFYLLLNYSLSTMNHLSVGMCS